MTDISKRLESYLIAQCIVFKSHTPEWMDFRKPETVTDFRGLYCKLGDESKWKFLCGSKPWADVAFAVLSALNLKPEWCEFRDPGFGITFEFDSSTELPK